MSGSGRFDRARKRVSWLRAGQFAVVLAALVAALGGFVGTAQATTPATLVAWDPVGSGVMQLNNNGTNGANPTTIPTSPQSDGFDRVYCQVLAASAQTCATGAGPTQALGGAVAVAFDHSATLNGTNFAGSSKDIGDIPGWSWSSTGGLPGKDILLDSAAAKYSAPNGPGGVTNLQTCPAGATATNCNLIDFASDRWDNSGDAQQGFWFFQYDVVACGSTTIDGTACKTSAPTLNGTFAMQCPQPGAGNCTGKPVGTWVPAQHKVGDLLVVSDFSVGGTTSTIDVYEWVGTGGNTSGTMNHIFGTGTTNAACDLVGPGAQVCGETNKGTANINSPWPFSDKKGSTTFRQGEYYNGSLNLSSFPGLAQECFGSFDAESRSSTSPTATLEDFIIGSFAKCGTTVHSQPQSPPGTSIAGSSVSIGTGSVSVQDQAVVAGSGASTPPTGVVNFSLCSGPVATPITACPSGSGTSVGSTNLSTGTVTGTSVTVASPSVNITSVGSYCFRADYAGDSNYPAATDGSTGECFTVGPVTPVVSTTASTGPVSLGTAIDDTASLTGTANEPGTPAINPSTAGGSAKGQLTFKLYGPNSTASCIDPGGTGVANLIATTTQTITGDGTSYKASAGTVTGTLTPTAAGTYYWTASYAGDSPNTNGTSEACGGSGESVVVSPNQPTIVTTATCAPATGCPLGNTLDDSAVLANAANEPNGNPASGTITFKLYLNDSTCAATNLVGTSVVSINGNGTYHAGATGATVTGTLTPTQPGTYYWTASYSGDGTTGNNLSATEGCNSTNEESLLIQLPTSISTAQSFVPNDSATITAPSGAGNLKGSVDFQLFVNASGTCSGTPAYDSQAIAINGGASGLSQTVSSSNTTAYGTSGTTTFNWLVTYTSTNAGHKSVTSSCTNESSSITVNNGSQQTSS